MAETSQKFIRGKIVRGESPLNLEMPFEQLEGFITPTELFYVRTHFPIPHIDMDAWWLRVEGDVENPFAINYEQLLELESMTVPVTLECAGNNRNFLEPKVKGVQWRLGAVGTAQWTGVSLSVLLDRAKPKPQASEVVLEGADGGILEDPKGPPGKLHSARRIEIQRVAALGIQLANACRARKTNAHRSRDRFTWPNATSVARSRSRHVHDQSPAAD